MSTVKEIPESEFAAALAELVWSGATPSGKARCYGCDGEFPRHDGRCFAGRMERQLPVMFAALRKCRENAMRMGEALREEERIQRELQQATEDGDSWSQPFRSGRSYGRAEVLDAWRGVR